MKYASTLPASALFAIAFIGVLVSSGVIPPGLVILESLKNDYNDVFFVMIFTIILLESIVYVGFYFPGQFFAVSLVIMSKPNVGEIGLLTLCMVAAATLGSCINFLLGRYVTNAPSGNEKIQLKSLLLAMIHMNALAFFMLACGSQRRSMRIVWLAGLINLPYYLLLISVTAFMSDEIMQVAENTWLLISVIITWLVVALVLDVKSYLKKKQHNQHVPIDSA